MQQGNFEERLKDEIEVARALTAVVLAVRFEIAETRAQEAYDRIVNGQDAA